MCMYRCVDVFVSVCCSGVTYLSCWEKSSLVSSSSQDSSHRCLVSLLLAASVSSTDQSALGVSHVIISGCG